MSIDSLLLSLLVGLLPGALSVHCDSLLLHGYDSLSLTLTIQLAGSSEMTAALPSPPNSATSPETAWPVSLPPDSRSFAITTIDRITAFATAWGEGSLFGEDWGFLSVSEIAGPGKWRFRTTISRSLLTGREERIKWSLVHGVF